MTQIDTRPTAANGRIKRTRSTFTLEFDCGGRPYHWTGTAFDRFEAESQARSALYLTHGGFHNPSARLVRVETA